MFLVPESTMLRRKIVCLKVLWNARIGFIDVLSERRKVCREKWKKGELYVGVGVDFKLPNYPTFVYSMTMGEGRFGDCPAVVTGLDW